MITRTVADLADLLGARVTGPAGAEALAAQIKAAQVEAVAVDSRAVGKGTLFVALPGERVDGHDYVETAFASGAVGALVGHPLPAASGPCLVVEDPLTALGRLARDQVDRGTAGGLGVVGITGSQGKTSTKDLLGQVLTTQGPTVAPAGNFNNEIGLPLTVARITEDTRFLVAEMGARGIGHIAYLCGIAPPRVGVVLNVGTAHVGEFGSRAAIAQAKGELVEALPPDGAAVLNADDPLVAAMASRTVAPVWGTSMAGDPGTVNAVWAGGIRADALGRARFVLHVRTGSEARPEVEIELAVTGRHQVANALAATAAAIALGLDTTQVRTGLAGAGRQSRWRMELGERADGALVVNDAYNANPESMHAALDTLAELSTNRSGLSWAVLGDMLELGAEAESAHVALGRYAADRGVQQLLAVGRFAAAVVAGARAANASISARAVEKDAVLSLVNSGLRDTDVILIKASRGLALDTVAEAILAAGEAGSRSPTSEDSA